MKLDFCSVEYDTQSRWCNLPKIACDWQTVPHPEVPQTEFQASTWVQLLELPNPFSFDEALLLCQQSADRWLAWVPDHGEVLLHENQFCATWN
ncbi:hypothetical protein H6G00_25605 [Leptolyngbya sp. FACHB-541]|uniref:hypothetical protein n=1 Tax=Leptolyngbya sp. FACHB-541 TaxID=2692810 RepID=UPI0016843370|nr:hypothetical protein [Leptolyngbya sp. FACHB-541]MBD1999946.1 hypothetical protein [Leptolyngbya sp. FACHB-541]